MNRSKTALLRALAAAALAGGALSIPAADPPGLALARQLNDAFVSVADKVSPSVVVLEVTEKPARGRGGFRRQAMGEGSGIIFTEDGYILTNEHVVTNADKINVKLQNGQEFPGSVVGADPKTDIAVVKISPKGAKLTAARLGDSSKLRVGEFVVAIGHPMDLTFSVTVGHVSALERLVPHSPSESEVNAQDYIQTDAVINPGNSGGPLINLDGEVIGINDMIEAYTDRFTGETINLGIGLAIPINVAKEVKDILMSEGKFTRSRIGIVMGSSQDPAELLLPGLKPVSSKPAGVEVIDITASSPASKSTLKVGDVIVSVDGAPVKTARDLYHAISFKRPGQTITLNVLRSEKPFSIKITTEAEPALAQEDTATPAPASTPSASESDYGFSVKDLTKDLAARFGVNASSGVLVTEVQLGSPAYRKDISPGDVIIKFNNKPVSNVKDFMAALNALKPNQQWTMTLAAKGAEDPAFIVMRDPRPASQ
ncbi:MAG: trypsin-like peptidase domain-containing protein [Verrucomicrobiota bacterium]